MDNLPPININQETKNGSAQKDTLMKEPTSEQAPSVITTTETATSIMSTSENPKKPPGSGPIPITMDVYHQLQQKRLLERQQQEQQEQQQRPNDTVASAKSDHVLQSIYSQASAVSQPSLNALEEIVNIVQATVPALPLQTQPQQIQMPGPDLANIIFGHTSSVAGSAMDTGFGLLGGHSKVASTLDGNSGPGINSRKNTSGSHGSAPASQSQPRTTSPPTPASGSSSTNAHKNTNVKGQKAIHAIELIRIAGEILQFPPTTTGTALIYYHKYRAYLHQANKRGERDNEASKADEY
ncbi:hypothetical protein BGZ46_002352, partial [Entomortierella lignicola]